MRSVALAGVLALALTAGVCGAEDYSNSDDAALQTKTAVAHESEEGAGIKHIDEGDVDTPVTRVGVMQDGQSYDDDTGMPDMVNSDSDMELD